MKKILVHHFVMPIRTEKQEKDLDTSSQTFETKNHGLSEVIQTVLQVLAASGALKNHQDNPLQRIKQDLKTPGAGPRIQSTPQPLTKPLLFIDGSDPIQVERTLPQQANRQKRDKSFPKVILVKRSLVALRKFHDIEHHLSSCSCYLCKKPLKH